MLRICAYFEYRGLLGSYTNEMGYFLMNRLSVRCFITLGTTLKSIVHYATGKNSSVS